MRGIFGRGLGTRLFGPKRCRSARGPTIVLNLAIVDALAAQEAMKVLPRMWPVLMADKVAVSDALLRKVVVARIITDALAVTDAQPRRSAAIRVVRDNLAVSEPGPPSIQKV